MDNDLNKKIDINMMRLVKQMEIKYTPEYFEELSKKHYKEDRQYPENFSNWYPHIKSFGQFKNAEVINNQIFTWEEVDTMQETDNISNVNWNKLNLILKPTLDKMSKFRMYSIKNGCFSNKFDFGTCISDKDELVQNLWKINYVSSMYDTGGYTELVVRELIPYNNRVTPTIYNGMPLRTELRVFYNMDKKKIEYVTDYWDYDYCYENLPNITDKIIFKWFHQQDSTIERLKYITDYIYKNIHSLEFDDTLKGIWSIDFMLCTDCEEYGDYDGVYLIDMARGFRSAYWDKDKIEE